jgi:hypothetical protein
MFQRKLACPAVSAHNIHEAKVAGRVQEGGTGAICFGKSTGYIKKTGQDSKGLGRWSWILLGGTNEQNTWIITAYNPCKNRNVNSGIMYQQQQRYFITKKKDLTCPLVLFRNHLIKQIREWHAAGDRIILFIDHNAHVINGQLGKALADKEGLDLQQAIVQHMGMSPSVTFFQGSRPIDGLWISSNLDISNVCVMPFGYGIGDHHAFILDIPIKSLVGIDPVKIVWPAGRQLNSRLPGCSKLYIDSLEGNITWHCLPKQLLDIHTGNYSDKEQARRDIIINKEGKAYMRRAEKICRKIRCCRIPFSLEVAIWIRQVQVYYSLLRHHKGKINNRGNLKQVAQQCNMPDPLLLLIQEITNRLEACKKECIFYQEHGRQFRRKHLENQKKIAQEQEDEEVYNKISIIIQQEQQ